MLHLFPSGLYHLQTQRYKYEQLPCCKAGVSHKCQFIRLVRGGARNKKTLSKGRQLLYEPPDDQPSLVTVDSPMTETSTNSTDISTNLTPVRQSRTDDAALHNFELEISPDRSSIDGTMAQKLHEDSERYIHESHSSTKPITRIGAFEPSTAAKQR